MSNGYGPVPLTVLNGSVEVDTAIDLVAGQLPIVVPMPKDDTYLYPTSEDYEAVKRGLYVYYWVIYHGPYRR